MCQRRMCWQRAARRNGSDASGSSRSTHADKRSASTSSLGRSTPATLTVWGSSAFSRSKAVIAAWKRGASAMAMTYKSLPLPSVRMTGVRAGERRRSEQKGDLLWTPLEQRALDCSAMQYRVLGRTGLNVSAVSFGAWAIGGTWGPVNDDDSLEALHRALDLGVNF